MTLERPLSPGSHHLLWACGLLFALGAAGLAAPAAASVSVGVAVGGGFWGPHAHLAYGPHWGPYWRPYWGPYWRPYWGPYWGSYGRGWYGPEPWAAGPVAANPDYGAVDLDVSPKRTEVYVDAQYAGLSGSFDGFPAYLWLERGPHELAFVKAGYRTETRRLTVAPTAVAELTVELAPGESVRPVAAAPPAGAPASRPASPGPAPTPPAGRDVRPEPGELRLAVTPGDASVYLDGRFLGSAEELGRLHAGLLVAAGRHRLQAVRPGYAPRDLEFSVEPGEPIELALELVVE